MEKSRFLSSLVRGSLWEQGSATVLQGLPGRATQRSRFSSGVAKNDRKKPSKHLEEEQSENLLLLNKIISSSVYAFL